MDGLVAKHSAIMDRYDPEKKIALVVDEWGAWYAPLPGSNPGFLVQQNSLRDAVLAALNINIFARHADRVRMANIAQMVNVLQAMVLTDKEKMVLTPTYHVFRMYVPFQDADLRPAHPRTREATRRRDQPAAPRRARGEGRGRQALAVDHATSIPASPPRWRSSLRGHAGALGAGETLTAEKVDSVNTFEAPRTVVPKPASATGRPASSR
jgi:alpha-N-arabinofuranosidase